MLGRFSRILVVADSTVARKIVRRFLDQLGFEHIDEAASGRAALALLAQHQYRLVISDWEMAPVNGGELLRSMRGDPRLRRVPFIMASEPGQRKFVDIARDDGATYFLAKPFTVDMLFERIARVEHTAIA